MHLGKSVCQFFHLPFSHGHGRRVHLNENVRGSPGKSSRKDGSLPEFSFHRLPSDAPHFYSILYIEDRTYTLRGTLRGAAETTSLPEFSCHRLPSVVPHSYSILYTEDRTCTLCRAAATLVELPGAGPALKLGPAGLVLWPRGRSLQPECSRGSARETLKGLCLDKAGSLFFMSFFSMHRGCLNGSDMPTSLAYIILLASGPSRLLLVLLRGALSSLKKSIGGAAVPKRPEQQ